MDNPNDVNNNKFQITEKILHGFYFYSWNRNIFLEYKFCLF